MAEDYEKLQNKDGFYLNVFLPGGLSQTAANYGVFFIARHPMEVLRAMEVHAVAGSDAGAVTLDIEKLIGTEAPGAGTSILASTFDLKSTANTVVKKQSFNLSTARRLKEGERFALLTSGTLTALEGVVVTLYCKLSNRGSYR